MQSICFNLFGVLKHEGDWYFAHCPPLDLTTQGRTAVEARRNLVEASELFLISCIERGSLDQALRELGWKVQKTNQRLPENAFRIQIPLPLRFAKSAPCPG